MMNKSRIAPPRPATTNPPTPVAPAELANLLHTVEDRCNRAVAVVNVAARAVEGDELNMYNDEDVQRALGASLERIAQELTEVSDRAARAARTAGGAA